MFVDKWVLVERMADGTFQVSDQSGDEYCVHDRSVIVESASNALLETFARLLEGPIWSGPVGKAILDAVSLVQNVE